MSNYSETILWDNSSSWPSSFPNIGEYDAIRVFFYWDKYGVFTYGEGIVSSSRAVAIGQVWGFDSNESNKGPVGHTGCLSINVATGASSNTVSGVCVPGWLKVYGTSSAYARGNSTNLNKVRVVGIKYNDNNNQKYKRTVLFNNPTGASSGTLSDNINNYDYVRVFYRKNANLDSGEVMVIPSKINSGNTISLFTQYASGSAHGIDWARLNLTGSSFSMHSGGHIVMANNKTCSYNSTNVIRVVKVIGINVGG